MAYDKDKSSKDKIKKHTKLKAVNQQLKALNQQLKATEQQLRAANQQLKADEQQLQAANQQLKADEQQLQAANQQLNAANQQLRADEEKLKQLNHNLGERVKELNCLHSLSHLAERRDVTLEQIFQEVVELMPPAWDYPDITAARITFEGKRFKTKNFRKTAWVQSADIKVHGRKTGTIEVCYLKKRPVIDEGPFLKEERELLHDLAERVGSITERKRAEEALNAANQQLKAANQQLQATEQQLRAANQQLRADKQQLKAAEQQLKAANQQLNASNQQLQASNQQLQAEVTERKKAEEKLAFSENIYRKTIENANGVPYQMRFSDDKYIFTGSGMEELTGIPLKEFNRKKFFKLIEDTVIIDPKGYENVQACWDAIEKGKVYRYQADLRIRTPQGQVKWLNDCSINVKDEKTGKVVSSIGILQDITARKRTEEQIIHHQEQLRALTSKLSSIEESERRYIAESIHDSIIQPLVFMDVKVKSLGKTTKDTNLTDSFGQMRSILAELIEKARSYTFDLSYPILYELGLEAAIEEWLRTEIRDKHKIAIEFKADSQSKDLEQSMITFLFKSVKELLINVVKHAEASNVKVSLAKEQNKMVVCVEDDGCGFDSDWSKEVYSKSSGFGLFSIRERLAYLGGNLNIESKPGAGSQIDLTVPLVAGDLK